MTDSQKFQEFLDNGQYSKHGLKKYEWIFGETFLSTGGIGTTINVLKHVNLGKNPRVLDIGSGLGGHSFLMAEAYNADVTGLDLSTNMVELAQEHLKNRPYLKKKVSFEIKDCTTCDFPENSFDLIYSRDCLLHIQHKPDLFSNIYKWLKPGGHVLFTDYVRGEDESKYTQEFRDYLKQRGYFMATMSEYKKVLEGSGFSDFVVEDWSSKFRQALELELSKLWESKEEFLQNFSQEDYDELESGWLNKIQRVENGDQGWVLGLGRK